MAKDTRVRIVDDTPVIILDTEIPGESALPTVSQSEEN